MILSEERFSPQSCAKWITHTGDRAVRLVTDVMERHRCFKILFLLLVVVVSFFLFANWSGYHQSLFGDQTDKLYIVDRLILDFIYYLLIGIVLGAAGFFLPTKLLPELHIIGFLFCLGSIASQNTPLNYDLTAFLLNIVGTYALYLAAYFLPQKYSLKTQLCFIYAACVLSLVLNSIPLLVADRNIFWYLQSIRLIFIFSTLVQERYHGLLELKSTSHLMSYIFSPSVFLTPLPVPSKEWQFTESVHQRLKGLFKILLCVLYLIVAVWLKISVINQIHPNTFSDWLAYGFLKYIFYYLASCAWIEIPIGLCQWMGGMPLPSGFKSPLLAVNPFERWRDWNFLYYRWFSWNIFMPIQKKTRSAFLAVMLVFLFTAFIHSGRENIYLLSLDTKIFSNKVLMGHFVFFVLHGLLVYAALKTNRLWGAKERLSGWRGVLMMTVLMSILHIIAL